MTNLFKKPIIDSCSGMSYLVAKKTATKLIDELPTIGEKNVWNQNTIWKNCKVKKVGDIQVYFDPRQNAYVEETDPRFFI